MTSLAAPERSPTPQGSAPTDFRIATLRDVERIEQTPLDRRIPFAGVYQALASSAVRHADSVAIRLLESPDPAGKVREILYRDLLKNIHRTANLLQELGVDGENAVSYLLPLLPETHYVLWGGEAAGVVNPINPMLEDRHIASILNAANSRVLVIEDSPRNWEKLAGIISQTPNLGTVLVVSDRSSWRPPFHLPERIELLDLKAELKLQDEDQLCFQPRTELLHRVALFHTGGTTGTPKLATQHHKGQLTVATCLGAMLELGPEKNVFCGLPMSHVNGVLITGLAPLLSGATITLLTPEGYRNKQVVQNFWKLASRYRANIFSAVPAICAALLDVPIDADIGTIEYCICGAAPIPAGTFRRFEETTGIKILEGYGLTETHCVETLNPAFGERRVGSVGMRVPYTELKTVHLDGQGRYLRDCEAEETGSIVVRGENLFSGYTDPALNLLLDDGWFNTGDIGRFDVDGYLWLAGRAKDLIIRGGHNIDPAITEEALAAHPAVQSAAAVGRPDRHVGEIPVAYVKLRPGFHATVEELAHFARTHVSERAAAPDWVEIVDVMPLTAVGKIVKRGLRQHAAARTFTELLQAEGITPKIELIEDEKLGMMARIEVAAEFVARAELLLSSFAVPVSIRAAPQAEDGVGAVDVPLCGGLLA
ncbi:MAG: acyl-CoA synthetase [Acidobacteriota bacterium]|nr:acyl-CoA synthetase [Acidobacteriota bacterium]